MELKKPFISGLVEACIDSTVQQDLLKTYAKECISFIEYGNLSITNVDPRVINRVEFTECEISPFHTHDIQCDVTEHADFCRAASTTNFSAQVMPLNTVQRFLVHTFSPNNKGRRPYPSAGGLYPVEPIVFLFSERIQHPPEFISGAYHFRAMSKELQLIKKIPGDYFYKQVMHGVIPEHHPCFAILYLAHLGKAIFKYRYRGYRQAMMEAGSMYQQATVVAQSMDIRTTVWSSFSEPELLYALDLDHGTFLPLTMQLFGYTNHDLSRQL